VFGTTGEEEKKKKKKIDRVLTGDRTTASRNGSQKEDRKFKKKAPRKGEEVRKAKRGANLKEKGQARR